MARVLWELLFALFSVMWVLPYSVRYPHLGWHGINMGKKCSKVWMAAPSCLFWAIWKERNRIDFENEEFSIHRMKNSFVCNFWFWTKSIVDEGPLPLISFFDWLGSRWGLVIFCIPFSFCSCFLAPLVYPLYALSQP